MEDFNQLSRFPGCYGNQQCLHIIHDIMVSFILLIFYIYGVERQMQYRSNALSVISIIE